MDHGVRQKEQARNQLAKDVRKFLRAGGKITKIRTGESQEQCKTGFRIKQNVK